MTARTSLPKRRRCCARQGRAAGGPFPCSASAPGCARPRCCWRCVLGGVDASSPPPSAAAWTADPDEQFLLDVNIRQLRLGDAVRAYNTPEGTCVVLGDFLTALDVPIPFSPPLEKAAVPDESRIEAGIRAVLGR